MNKIKLVLYIFHENINNKRFTFLVLIRFISNHTLNECECVNIFFHPKINFNVNTFNLEVNECECELIHF